MSQVMGATMPDERLDKRTPATLRMASASSPYDVVAPVVPSIRAVFPANSCEPLST